MIVSDIARAILVSLIPALYHFHMVNVVLLCCIAFLVGTFSQFAEPAVRSSVPRIVSKDQLLAANSKIGFWQQVARLLSPAIGGVVMGWFGPAALLVFDGISYLVSAACAQWMSFASEGNLQRGEKSNLLHDTRNGMNFLLEQRWVLWLVTLGSIVNLALVGTITVLPPLLAQNVQGFAEAGYGMFLSAFSCGMLVGVLLIKKVNRRVKQGMIFAWSFLLAGFGYAVIGISMNAWLIMAGFFLTGIFINSINVSFMTLLQGSIEPERLGMVFGIVGMCSMGLTPLSNFLTGWLAGIVPLSPLFIGTGVLMAVSGLFCLGNRKIATMNVG